MVLSWLMPYFASARYPPPGNARFSGIALDQHGCGIHVVSFRGRAAVRMKFQGR
jgi:hypothetical protein